MPDRLLLLFSLFLAAISPLCAAEASENPSSLVFKEVNKEVGLTLEPADFRNAWWADFNGDGWVDLIAHGHLWINNGAQARIALDGQALTRQVEAGTGQGNQNDLTLHFGLGNQTSPVSVTIARPDGSVQTLDGVKVNQLVSATMLPPRWEDRRWNGEEEKKANKQAKKQKRK